LKTPRDPDLELRGKLIRSLGLLREMLPGSFVERQRSCGRPNCHCADGKRLHSQFQISVLIDGKPKALNIPAQWVDQVREKIELRRRFDAAAATICGVNLKRFLKEKLKEKEDPQS
jgi:gluconate kinase